MFFYILKIRSEKRSTDILETFTENAIVLTLKGHFDVISLLLQKMCKYTAGFLQVGAVRAPDMHSTFIFPYMHAVSYFADI